MKLQIFMIKKFLRWAPKVFLKECKYIEKNIISHIIDGLESSSADSDKEQIKSKYQDNNIYILGYIRI